MRASPRHVLFTISLVVLLLTACQPIQPAGTVPSPTGLQPGDTVDGMRLARGPEPFDLNVPPYVVFCPVNPMLAPGETVLHPGTYTVECSMPPLPQTMIGMGWVAPDEQALDDEWAAVTSELYVNGQRVDQEAFGSQDAVVPNVGVPGHDPDEVVEMPLRTWNVALENLQPGPLELRVVQYVAHDLQDAVWTILEGTYDQTYKITVDESMPTSEGAPPPVALASDTGLQPGDMVDGMRLARGPDPFDGSIPPYPAFCDANPQLAADPTLGVPGVYVVECSVPPLPQWSVGFGWVTLDEASRDEGWAAMTNELYINGQRVDQEAFGLQDGDLAGGARKLRHWNVILENLQPGPLEIRHVFTIASDLTDSENTMPKGVYDITLKATVEEPSTDEGTPTP